jgi:hypothetical protein
MKSELYQKNVELPGDFCGKRITGVPREGTGVVVIKRSLAFEGFYDVLITDGSHVWDVGGQSRNAVRKELIPAVGRFAVRHFGPIEWELEAE